MGTFIVHPRHNGSAPANSNRSNHDYQAGLPHLPQPGLALREVVVHMPCFQGFLAHRLNVGVKLLRVSLRGYHGTPKRTINTRNFQFTILKAKKTADTK